MDPRYFPDMKDFAWQEGYGAFSVAVSGVAATIAYIEQQAAHHMTRTFEQEFIAFLESHELAFDPRYVFG